MNDYTKAIKAIAARGENSADTDIVKDGIRYCAICGEPKQHRLHMKEEVLKVPITCKCARDRNDELRKKDAQMQKMCEIEGNRRRCFGRTQLHLWDFSEDDGKNPQASTACKNYVESWNENKASGLGLLLYGGVGTGKTFLAACIANALIDKGERVLMTTFAEIISQAQIDAFEVIDNINNFGLLIIDDLGVERGTEFGVEQVYQVIDLRYRSGKPIIITTNLPIEQIKNPTELKFVRIYDRILDICHPVKVDGKSRRRQSLAEKFFKRKEALGV